MDERIDLVRGPGNTVTINGVKVWPLAASAQGEAQQDADVVRLLDAFYCAGVAAPDTFAPYDESQMAAGKRALAAARAKEPQ